MGAVTWFYRWFLGVLLRLVFSKFGWFLMACDLHKDQIKTIYSLVHIRQLHSLLFTLAVILRLSRFSMRSVRIFGGTDTAENLHPTPRPLTRRLLCKSVDVTFMSNTLETVKNSKGHQD
jgi:hypothetical protein